MSPSAARAGRRHLMPTSSDRHGPGVMAIAVGWCPTLIARDSSQPDADQDAAEPAARHRANHGQLIGRIQTRNAPLGVLTGISRAPPERTARRSQVAVSKYET